MAQRKTIIWPVEITEKERRVLRSIITNYFSDSDNPCNQWVWSNCINDAGEPSNLTSRNLAGVVASLNAKSLVVSSGEGRDACVALLPAGLVAAGGLQHG